MVRKILFSFAHLGKAATGTKIGTLYGVTNHKASVAWIGRVFNGTHVKGAGLNAGLEFLRLFEH